MLVTQTDDAAGACGLILYGICFVLYLIIVFRTRKLLTTITTTSVFHAQLFCFLLFRFIWFAAFFCYEACVEVRYFLDACAFAWFFSAFLTVAFMWAEILGPENSSASFLPYYRGKYFVVMGLVWTYSVADALVFGVSGTEVRTEYQNAIESYYVSIVLVSFLLAAVFVTLAAKILQAIHSRASREHKGKLQLSKRLTLLASAFVFCCLLRVGIFIYHPITKRPPSIFYWFTLGYFVPELVPISSQLLVYWLKSRERIGNREAFLDSSTASEIQGG